MHWTTVGAYHCSQKQIKEIQINSYSSASWRTSRVLFLLFVVEAKFCFYLESDALRDTETPQSWQSQFSVECLKLELIKWLHRHSKAHWCWLWCVSVCGALEMTLLLHFRQKRKQQRQITLFWSHKKKRLKCCNSFSSDD